MEIDENGQIVADALNTPGRWFRMGRTLIGTWVNTLYAVFMNEAVSANHTTDYCMIQSDTGDSYFNAKSGQSLHFRINNSDVGSWNTSGLSVIPQANFENAITISNEPTVEYHTKVVTITAAEINQLYNISDKELIPAPGVNKVVEIISTTIWKPSGTAHVHTAGDLYIRPRGFADYIFKFDNCLVSSGELLKKGVPVYGEWLFHRENVAYDLHSFSPNPTGGGPSFKVFLHYAVWNHG